MRSTGSKPILQNMLLSFLVAGDFLSTLWFNAFSSLPPNLPNIFRKEPKAKAFNKAIRLKWGTSGPPTITGLPHCSGIQYDVGKYNDGMGLNFLPGRNDNGKPISLQV